MADIRHKSVY